MMLLHLFYKAVGLQMLLTWNAAQELNETQLSVDQEILQAYLSSNASRQMSDPSYVRVQIDMLFEAAAYREMIRTPDSNSNSTGRVRRKAFRDESLRWPNATVPYTVSATFNNVESEALRQAINDYHTYSCVRFRDALPGDVDYLRIVDGRGCLSHVGRQGGMQELILARKCRKKGVIIHELGHVLGFVHEHSRPDRDLYVSIKSDNILEDNRYDFEKFNELTVSVDGIPYDYESIMHYGSHAAARNNNSIVIETKNASYQNIIGQRRSLSFRDVKLVNMMFRCSERSRCPRKSCPGEGFVGNDCRCWCPSGGNTNIAAAHCPENAVITSAEPLGQLASLPVDLTTRGEESTVTPASPSFAEVCTLGWTESGNFCYRVTNPISWGAAQQECRRLNAYLVDIRNIGEETSLYDFLNYRGVDRAWIGLNDLRAEGQWAWDSGERVTYVNWSAGEPNDDRASEDCVEVLAAHRRGWNDNNCNRSFPGVCSSRKGNSNACRGTFVGFGNIRSPNFPQNYPNNIRCEWTLQPSSVTALASVEIRRFSTERCCDIVRISDQSGQQFSLAGEQQQQVAFLRLPANVSFTTDHSVTNIGFEIVFNATSIVQAEFCTLGWTESGNFCYRVTESTSWGAAQQECRRLNAYLVDIGNLREQTSLYDFLNSQGVDRAWIGLNDLRAEGQWAWDSGEQVTYVNWSAGEPNDDRASEDCVEVLAAHRRGWNDNSCNRSFPGVCRSRKVRV